MSKAISVRLDPEALRALAQLEMKGLTRSEAVSKALIKAAEGQRGDRSLAAEVVALEADEADRREIRRVAEVLEELRGGPGDATP